MSKNPVNSWKNDENKSGAARAVLLTTVTTGSKHRSENPGSRIVLIPR
jgi:hypothetical protein